jgi:hypothetical protein
MFERHIKAKYKLGWKMDCITQYKKVVRYPHSKRPAALFARPHLALLVAICIVCGSPSASVRAQDEAKPLVLRNADAVVEIPVGGWVAAGGSDRMVIGAGKYQFMEDHALVIQDSLATDFERRIPLTSIIVLFHANPAPLRDSVSYQPYESLHFTGTFAEGGVIGGLITSVSAAVYALFNYQQYLGPIGEPDNKILTLGDYMFLYGLGGAAAGFVIGGSVGAIIGVLTGNKIWEKKHEFMRRYPIGPGQWIIQVPQDTL